MKATITTMITIGICALAIPAGASADPLVDGWSYNAISEDRSSDSGPPVDGWSYNSISKGSSDSSQPSSDSGKPVDGYSGKPVDGWSYPTLNPGLSPTGQPSPQSGSNGSPVVDSGAPAGTTDGFDTGSAAVGAGIALALVALGGAALLTLRRRTPMTPSARPR